MKKITIDPHHCSREEYQELIDYLERNCWDYKQEEQEEEKKEVRYILKGSGIQCNLSSTEFIELNEKIRDEDLHEYSITHRESFIDELYRWIAEARDGAQRQMMKDDLDMLKEWDDEYIFSSNSTNSYISSQCSEFEKTCEELIEINKGL